MLKTAALLRIFVETEFYYFFIIKPKTFFNVRYGETLIAFTYCVVYNQKYIKYN